eukprot:GILJ01008562.1.p1 GENE.GILJ01008562.1~~GILJ01008562.1.p1  ORF type:complete len:749 (+),score=132.63 GILJ01008562.1:105-2249(+)
MKLDSARETVVLSDSDRMLITQLQSRIEQQKQELDQRTSTVSALQRNFESLSSLCKEEREEMLVLKRARTDLETELMKLRKTLERYESLNQDLQAEVNLLQPLQRQCEELTRALSEAKGESTSNASQLTTKLRAVAGLESQLASVRVELESSKNREAALQKLNEEIRKKMSDADATNVQQRTQADQSQTKLIVCEQQLKDKISELALLADKCKSKDKQIQALEGELTQTRESLRRVEGQVNVMQGSSRSLEAMAKLSGQAEHDYKEKLKALQGDMEVVKQKLTAAVIDNGVLDQQVTDLQNQVNAMQRSEGSLKADLLRTASELQVAVEERNRAVADCQTATTDRTEAFERMKRLQTEFATISDALQKAKSREIEFLRQVESLQKEKQSLSEASSVALKMAHDQARTNDLSSQVRSLKESNAKLTQSLGSAEATISTLNRELIQRQAEMEELKQASAVAAAESSMELNQKLNQKDELVVLLTEKIQSSESELASLRSDIQNNSEELTRLRKTVLEKDSKLLDVQRLQSAVNNWTSMFETVDAKRQAAESQLLAARKETESVKETLFLKEKEISRLQEDISDLQKVLNDRNREMQGLNEKYAHITDVESRIRAVEMRERDLQTSISKLIHIEESMDAVVTCMVCLNVLDKPVTCMPCGHSYCTKCKEGYTPHCQECGPAKRVEARMSNPTLELVCGKMLFKKQALDALKAQLRPI